ncbi:hypothetical protein EJ08DRAFT_728485 [Tothia fuscella]|uniref:MAPEG family protein n=1 Tax=Tothia fuscella TaxID=1048955 RepID=A0A9P4P1Y0_9PEZI|nr:hypothetical protein EJ08DRAFT_728485 [Tothia fuscella]
MPMSASNAVRKIVYAWAIAFSPHLLKIIILNAGGYKWDNSIGRYNMSTDINSKAPKVSRTAIARAKRADAAHSNGQESFPLFAAAVLAAVAAGVDGETVDGKTGLYLGLRIVYNAIFILGESQGIAALRTLVWGGSVYSSISLILKAANTLAAKGL